MHWSGFLVISKTVKSGANRSDGENHIVAVSEPKIVNTKDISKGENLSKEPKDEIFDALPSHF